MLVQVPGHPGRRAPEDADRRDRQARIQAGRSRRRRGAGRHHQAGAARRRARLWHATTPPQSLCAEGPGAGHRPEPGRRAARLRQPHRRAGGDLPLRRRRRQALRQGDPGECRPALRHRARQQGGLRAGHPRADPRRHRPDQRQFHRAAGQRPRRAAQIRRAAGQAHRHRGTHRRREPRRGLDRVGQEGRASWGSCSS